MTITLKRAAACKQCGTQLRPGTRAKWYRNGDVYGIGCHASRRSEPIGQTLSRYDPYGLYAADGTRIAVSCGCEDYPCCGH